MSWQDELRQLDQALASGRITADVYRQRRDQILILAAHPGGEAQPPAPDQPTPAGPPPAAQPQQVAPAPAGPEPAQATQFVPPAYPPRPDRGQPGPGPFAPPFRWTSTGPETTQVVKGDHLGSAEATQVVKGTPEVERTQAFPPVSWPQPGGQQQFPQRQNWGPGADAVPPWGADGGAIRTPNPTWLTQGPEVFEKTGRGGRGKIALIALGVVVVLGLGVGGYLVFNHGGSAQASSTSQSTTRPTTTRPKPKPKPAHPDEPLLDQLPAVVGTINARGAIFNNNTDMLSRHLIDEATANMFSAAGVQQVAWRDGSKAADQDGPTADYFTVQAIALGNPDSAATLAQNLQHYQETHEFVRVPQLPSVPSTVVIEKNITPGVSRYRGIWVVGNDVIWVSVEQQPLSSEPALTTSFEREIKTLLPSFPAD